MSEYINSQINSPAGNCNVTFNVEDRLDITGLAKQVNPCDLSFAQAVGPADLSIIEHASQN
jgi:hypothetical protein